MKFGFSGNSTLFSTIGAAIGKAFYILSASVGTILLTLGGAYAGGFEWETEWGCVSGFWPCSNLIVFNPFTYLILGASFLLFGGIGTYRDQRYQQDRIDTLEKNNAELDSLKRMLNSSQEDIQLQKAKMLELNFDLVITWMKGAFKALDLTSNDRITIYYEYDGVFSLLARYSSNPTYKVIHRQKFPLNQGVISRAWQHGSYIERGCPSWEQPDEYKRFMVDTYGYEVDKIDLLTMKSCRYLAKAIVDADDHIGVIVFESSDSAFFDVENREEQILAYCEGSQGQLSKFVRDGLSLDTEIGVRREGKAVSVESDILETVGGTL